MKTVCKLLFILLVAAARADDTNQQVAPAPPAANEASVDESKAVAIPVRNPSFETLAREDIPSDWTTSDPAEFKGFTGFSRGNDQYGEASDGVRFLEITAMDKGNPVGFSYFQNTGFVAEPGDVFVLRVAVRNGGKVLPKTFSLTLDGSPVAFNSEDGKAIANSNNSAVFYDQTIFYTVTDPAMAGASVGVSLYAAYGNQIDYDNVRLSVIKGPSTADRSVARVVPKADRKGLRVFSCGHSYHFLNYNLPILLREVARAGGFPDHEIMGQSVIFGSKVIQHWDVKDEENKPKAALLAGNVDVLTLTTVYLPDEGIEKFAELGVEHNPNIRVTIQENWLPFDANNRHHFDPPTEPRPDTVDHNAATPDFLSGIHQPYWAEMDALVTSINEKLGKPVVFVVPVGEAVNVLRGKVSAGQVPGIKTQEELFTDMLGHPGAAIQALTAYCHYAVIYKKNPAGLPVPTVLKLSKIPPENLEALNQLLQQLAWDAVTSHPLSGVTK